MSSPFGHIVGGIGVDVRHFWGKCGESVTVSTPLPCRRGYDRGCLRGVPAVGWVPPGRAEPLPAALNVKCEEKKLVKWGHFGMLPQSPAHPDSAPTPCTWERFYAERQAPKRYVRPPRPSY